MHMEGVTLTRKLQDKWRRRVRYAHVSPENSGVEGKATEKRCTKTNGLFPLVLACTGNMDGGA